MMILSRHSTMLLQLMPSPCAVEDTQGALRSSSPVERGPAACTRSPGQVGQVGQVDEFKWVVD